MDFRSEQWTQRLSRRRTGCFPHERQPWWEAASHVSGRLPNGQEQQIVDSRGVPKGLRQVLQECGVDSRKMKRKDMVERLQQFDDFKYELNTVQRYQIKDLGHRCISLPKYCFYRNDLLTS